MSTEGNNYRKDHIESSHSFHTSDKMIIEIVRNVDVQPKYKAIYLTSSKRNEFPFNINHGSGRFSVTIDYPEIADLYHRDRTITIVAKN